MPEKINVSMDKTLKLNNVLLRRIKSDEFTEFGKIVQFMEDYIKSKGAQPIGPLIQYTKAEVDEDGQPEINVTLLRQSTNFINHIESPYAMESVKRVKNCLYTRFIGAESKMDIAYDKLGVVAYEEDIKVTGETYTVFVNQVDDNIVADIFMERATDE